MKKTRIEKVKTEYNVCDGCGAENNLLAIFEDEISKPTTSIYIREFPAYHLCDSCLLKAAKNYIKK